LRMSLIEKALKILKVSEFITVATSNGRGRPNAAPKLLLKIDGRTAYIVDYSIGRTYENLKINPEISLSFIDAHSLFAYRLNGSVEIIEKGRIYKECLKELRKKEIDLSVERIVQGVQEGKAHQDFELGIPEQFLLYKVAITEGCEITPRGVISRES
jgi:uncharacterized pyridoxamine 5'-phosphate oxidase family protein